jgi:hypothetical protein
MPSKVDQYKELVQTALDDSLAMKLSRKEYKSALEDIKDDIESRVDAVTEEIESEEEEDDE